MRPKDFWRLHPTEFWWLYDLRKPVKMYGSLSESDVAELYQHAYGDGQNAE